MAQDQQREYTVQQLAEAINKMGGDFSTKLADLEAKVNTPTPRDITRLRQDFNALHEEVIRRLDQFGTELTKTTTNIANQIQPAVTRTILIRLGAPALVREEQAATQPSPAAKVEETEAAPAPAQEEPAKSETSLDFLSKYL